MLPTPTARLGDPKRGMPSPTTAATRWAQRKRNLDDAVMLLPTPTATLATKGGRVTPRKGREGGTLSEALTLVPAGAAGTLHPRFVEHMMGFPPGWTDLDDDDDL
jgi:hypothetical protein